MVRMGGLTYTIAPGQIMGKRITQIRVGGKAMDPSRRYKATGWASIGEADGPPAYDVVAEYLRSVKRVKLDARPRVKIL